MFDKRRILYGFICLDKIGGFCPLKLKRAMINYVCAHCAVDIITLIGFADTILIRSVVLRELRVYIISNLVVWVLCATTICPSRKEWLDEMISLRRKFFQFLKKQKRIVYFFTHAE